MDQGKTAGRSLGLGELFQTLIAAGHRKDDLPHYTRRQLRLYYREVEKSNNRGRACRIEDINIGYNGGKETNEILKALRNLPANKSGVD